MGALAVDEDGRELFLRRRGDTVRLVLEELVEGDTSPEAVMVDVASWSVGQVKVRIDNLSYDIEKTTSHA